MSKISLKCVIKFGVNSQANNTHAKGVTKHAQMPLRDRTLDYKKNPSVCVYNSANVSL